MRPVGWVFRLFIVLIVEFLFLSSTSFLALRLCSSSCPGLATAPSSALPELGALPRIASFPNHDLKDMQTTMIRVQMRRACETKQFVPQ